MQLQTFTVLEVVSSPLMCTCLIKHIIGRCELLSLMKFLLLYLCFFNEQFLYMSFVVRYCECFASGVYCDGCNCVNCHNNVENEPARREAVETTLERNPNAFRPKIASSPHGNRDNRVSLSQFANPLLELPR